MRRRKEYYFTIGLALTLLFVVFAIAIILLKPNNAQNSFSPKPTLAPSPTITLVPTVSVSQPGPQLNLDFDAQQQLITRVENRKTLSSTDMEAKAKILSLLPQGKQSGYVYQSPTIKIEFVNSANLFMVEILTIDVGTAKNEANVWFRSQGMSQDAICNYPVMFYLNSDVLSRIKTLRIKFSPIGNGC